MREKSLVTSWMISIIWSLDVTGHRPHGSLPRGPRRQTCYIIEFMYISSYLAQKLKQDKSISLYCLFPLTLPSILFRRKKKFIKPIWANRYHRYTLYT